MPTSGLQESTDYDWVDATGILFLFFLVSDATGKIQHCLEIIAVTTSEIYGISACKKWNPAFNNF